MPAGARERRDRLVSSEYWWIWAVRPCLAAMVRGCYVVVAQEVLSISKPCYHNMTRLIPGVQLSSQTDFMNVSYEPRIVAYNC